MNEGAGMPFKRSLHFLSLIAALGLILSILSHLAALLGKRGPLGDYAWLLHVGIFVVWIPTVLVAQRLGSGLRRQDFVKVALRRCPGWTWYSVFGFFGYAVLNFILFAAHAPPKGGFSAMTPTVLRGFSGHWMAFYSVAAAVLFSAARMTEAEWQGRKCVNGHSVSPKALFCEQCGRPAAGTF
jgi:hypothetical protein